MYIKTSNYECEDCYSLHSLDSFRNEKIYNIQLISFYNLYRWRRNGYGGNRRYFDSFLERHQAECHVETVRSKGSSWSIEIESRVLFQNSSMFIIMDFEDNFGSFKPFRGKNKKHLEPNFLDIMHFIENESNWKERVRLADIATGKCSHFIGFDFYNLSDENIYESDATYSPYSNDLWSNWSNNVELEWNSVGTTSRNENNNFKAFLWFQKAILNAHDQFKYFRW